MRMLLVLLSLSALLSVPACAHKPCACGEAATKTETQKPAETKAEKPAPQAPAEKDCKTANERGECALTPEELKELKDAAMAPKAP